MRSRDTVLETARHAGEVDVLIVGGGINGIGVYRDLAAQGVAALLVERSDFCSGTSAAPSRLIHGGLRYLETGEFALVRESVEERNRLLRNAPHLVQPMPVWIPLQSWWAGLLRAPARLLRLTTEPGPKGALMIKLGLVFYDWFGRDLRAAPAHRLVPRDVLRAAMPSLAAPIKLAAEYYDARLVHPERLALELIDDAERDCAAAIALPYVGLAGHENGTVLLEDMTRGGRIRVRPRVVVNVSGAWGDQVNRRLGVDTNLIGGTRGSHVVLRHAALAGELGGRMIYFETPDHRVCLAYSLGDERVLLGTTDIRSDDPDDTLCSDAEIEYLFEMLHGVMPGMRVGREHIVFHFAGVRPLPRASTANPGAISRDHTLHAFDAEAHRPFVLFSLVGGKWTTYRACAAQIADAVLARLDRPRRTDTGALPIGGGREWPETEEQCRAAVDALETRFELSHEYAQTLWERYGTASSSVARTIAATSAAPLDGLPTHTEGEIAHIARHERVTHLSDVVLRRTLIAFEGRCSERALRALSNVLGVELGWDGARCEQEAADAAALLSHRHGAKVALRPREPASQ